MSARHRDLWRRAAAVALLAPAHPLPLTAQQTNNAVRIFVGPNHEALAGFDEYPGYHEGWIAASPTNRNVLVAVSKTGKGGCANSVSADGGNTWQLIPLAKSDDCFDPMVVPGIDGRIHILHTGRKVTAPGSPSSQKQEPPVRIFTTLDDGRSWSGPVELRTMTKPDHPRMTVDRTRGPHRGRIYVAWNEAGDPLVRNRYRLYLHYSDDHGATFTDPMLIACDSGGKLVITEPLVLSDGTLLITYYKYFFPFPVNDRNDRKPFYLLRSRDGGKSFDPAEKVLEIGMGRRDYETGLEPFLVLPIVAGDESETSRYRDRIYVVWHDANAGEPNIWLAWSADTGKSWSRKVRVNDNAPARVKGRMQARFLPVVAVNQDGVVGVAWYDLREDPRCWKAYFAASFDGGETFTRNVPVSSMPSCAPKNTTPVLTVKNAIPESPLPFTQDTVQRLLAAGKDKEAEEFIHILGYRAARDAMGRTALRLTFGFVGAGWPGDYMGLAADVGGAFHALWVDTRARGPQKLYSARIEIETGEEPSKAKLREKDVTELVEVRTMMSGFDEDAGLVTFSMTLRNASDQAIEAPLRVRVKKILRGGRRDVVVNPDGKETGEGAFWDFSSAIGTRGRLGPGDISEPRTVNLRVRPEEALDVVFEFEVIGRLPAERDAPTTR